MNYVICYLTVINIAAFLIYGLDKRRAMKDRWRIPESTLLGVAVIGGTVGAFLGMMFFRHKIRKWKFVLGVPLIFVLQAVAASYIVSVIIG